MTLVEPELAAAEVVDDDLGEVRVVVDPGLSGWEDDVDLVANAIGWLTSDPVALGEVADRLMDRVVECPLGPMSDDQLRSVAARWETVATRVQAVRADLAAEIDRRGHERDAGFFST
ncbi:MAG: hypothetical protein AAGD33_13485, partial [Actinomycetota bacterium]